jgi:hypothetical protein
MRMTEDRLVDHERWPERAFILMGVGALFGLIISILLDGPGHGWTKDPVRLAASFFFGISGILLGFTLERPRWKWSVAFAAAGGLVVALTYHWNGAPNGWDGSEGWRLVSAILAIVIAAPLFQTMRDAGAGRLPYAPVHAHAWTNVVLWVVAWGFVLIVFLLMLLLSALFQLIGIRLIEQLMESDWFLWTLLGAALGGVLGILRDRDKVLGTLQRVAMAILSVLAPVLAAGLAIFVLSLPVTGLSSLWEETKSTTPILLSCIAGAFILANAVIGNSAEEESKGCVLRMSAMVLGAVMLPLAIVALVSTSLRIGQYGFTPSRLWAMTFVLVALICAIGYLYALARGRWEWAGRLRPINVRLAIFICGLAFLLATPLINFGEISTRDQVARLESGKVSIEQFDWRALRFDFGPSGMKALRRLAQNSDKPDIRRQAAEVIAEKDRWEMAVPVPPQVTQAQEVALARWQVLPRPLALPPELREAMRLISYCNEDDRCRIYYEEGSETAVAVRQSTCTPPPASRAGTMPDDACAPEVRPFYKNGNEWRVDKPLPAAGGDPVQRTEEIRRAMDEGQVTIREVARHQVFVGDRPVGQPFE